MGNENKKKMKCYRDESKNHNGDSDSSDEDDDEGQIRPCLSKRVAFDKNFHKKKFEKPVTQKLSFFLPRSCFNELKRVGQESRKMMFDLGNNGIAEMLCLFSVKVVNVVTQFLLLCVNYSEWCLSQLSYTHINLSNQV